MIFHKKHKIPVKCAEECEIICLKFTEWLRDHSWEEQYRDQKTYTDKQLFNIFINNHLI